MQVLKEAQKRLLLQLANEERSSLAVLPAVCYALNDSIMTQEVMHIIDTYSLKSFLNRGDYNACIEEQGYFYILVLYFVRCYFSDARGDNFRKTADPQQFITQPEWERLFDRNLLAMKRWRRARGCSVQDWLNEQCWVLSCDEGRGLQSNLRRRNGAVSICLKDVLQGMSSLSTLAAQEAEITEYLAGVDEDLFYSSLSEEVPSYIASLWEAPHKRVAYLCSLKALTETGAEPPSELSQSSRWGWLSHVWGRGRDADAEKQIIFRWVFVKGKDPHPKLMVYTSEPLRGHFYQDDTATCTECGPIERVYHVAYWERFDLHKRIKVKLENEQTEYEIPPLYPSPHHSFVMFRRRPMEDGCSLLYNRTPARAFCLAYPSGVSYTPVLEEGGECRCVEKGEASPHRKWDYAIYELPRDERRELTVRIDHYRITLCKPSSLQCDIEQEIFLSGNRAGGTIVVAGGELPVTVDGAVEIPAELVLEESDHGQCLKLGPDGKFYKLYFLKNVGKRILFLPSHWTQDTQRVSTSGFEEAITYAEKGLQAYHVHILNEEGEEEDCVLTINLTAPVWAWESRLCPGKYSRKKMNRVEAQDDELVYFPRVGFSELEVEWCNLCTGRMGTYHHPVRDDHPFRYTSVLADLQQKKMLQPGDVYSLSFGGCCLLQDTWSPLNLTGTILSFPALCRKQVLRIRHELYYCGLVKDFPGEASVMTRSKESTYRMEDILPTPNATKIDLKELMESICREDGYWEVSFLQGGQVSEVMIKEPQEPGVLPRWGLSPKETFAAYYLSRHHHEFCSSLIGKKLSVETANFYPPAHQQLLETLYQEYPQLNHFYVDSRLLRKDGFAYQEEPVKRGRGRGKKENKQSQANRLPMEDVFPFSSMEGAKHLLLKAVTFRQRANEENPVVGYWSTDGVDAVFAKPLAESPFSLRKGHIEQMPPFASRTARNSSGPVKQLVASITAWFEDVVKNEPEGLKSQGTAALTRQMIVSGWCTMERDMDDFIRCMGQRGDRYALNSLPQLLYALFFHMHQERGRKKLCADYYLGALELLRVIQAEEAYTPQPEIAYVFERMKESPSVRKGMAQCLFLLLWLDAVFSTR